MQEWTVPHHTRRDGNNRCWVMQGKTSICRCFGKPKTAEANAHLIASAPTLKQQRDDLLEACEAWMKVESEMKDKNPCPDLALRANYRKEAVKLTEAAVAKYKD